MDDSAPDLRLSRRRLLIGGAATALAVADGLALKRGIGPSHQTLISPFGPQVAAAEAARYQTGRVVDAELLPRIGQLDLAGRIADTWLYSQQVPGPELRLRPGDQLRATVLNGLPQPTSVHWHGIQLRCDMDGVPGMTEAPLDPAGELVYQFTVPDPGTYFYHPHVGTQPDRGLYGPLIVEDPDDPYDVDLDLTVMVDDWIDGLGTTPDNVLDRLQHGQVGGSTVPAMDGASPWGPMLGDVVYPFHLINGRPPADPQTWVARPGQRVRFRLINASADTDFRLALGGHPMTVIAADGWSIAPVETDALLIGKAERYDVVVTVADGVIPIVAKAEGRDGLARALIRSGAGSVPPAGYLPPELSGRLLDYSQLHPTPATALPARRPDRVVAMSLGRDLTKAWRWTLDGQTWPDAPPVDIHQGERIRIRFENTTNMAHPMHIHGHTFALAGSGTRKDTVVVLPGRTLSIDVEGDNPGQWMFHCHDLYHLLGGMATVLSYLT